MKLVLVCKVHARIPKSIMIFHLKMTSMLFLKLTNTKFFSK